MCRILFPVTQIIHMQGIKVCVIMVHLLPSVEIIVQDVSSYKIKMSVCLYVYASQYMFNININKYLIVIYNIGLLWPQSQFSFDFIEQNKA